VIQHLVDPVSEAEAASVFDSLPCRTAFEMRIVHGGWANAPSFGDEPQSYVCCRHDDAVAVIARLRFAKPKHRKVDVAFVVVDEMVDPAVCVAAMVHWMFTWRDVNRIECNLPERDALVRALEKCHFMREAVFAEALYLNGSRCGAAVYAVLRSDWNARMQH